MSMSSMFTQTNQFTAKIMHNDRVTTLFDCPIFEQAIGLFVQQDLG